MQVYPNGTEECPTVYGPYCLAPVLVHGVHMSIAEERFFQYLEDEWFKTAFDTEWMQSLAPFVYEPGRYFYLLGEMNGGKGGAIMYDPSRPAGKVSICHTCLGEGLEEIPHSSLFLHEKRTKVQDYLDAHPEEYKTQGLVLHYNPFHRYIAPEREQTLLTLVETVYPIF